MEGRLWETKEDGGYGLSTTMDPKFGRPRGYIAKRQSVANARVSGPSGEAGESRPSFESCVVQDQRYAHTHAHQRPSTVKLVFGRHDISRAD